MFGKNKKKYGLSQLLVGVSVRFIHLCIFIKPSYVCLQKCCFPSNVVYSEHKTTMKIRSADHSPTRDLFNYLHPSLKIFLDSSVISCYFHENNMNTIITTKRLLTYLYVYIYVHIRTYIYIYIYIYIYR